MILDNIRKIWPKIHARWQMYHQVRPFAKKNTNRIITPQNTICLFCHPRGGSTWLAELLMQIPGSVLIDEPLWRGLETIPFSPPAYGVRKVPAIAALQFFNYQYIPAKTSWPAAKDAFGDILAGRVASLGLYNEQPLSRLGNNNLYITKFCYANLLMPWLLNQWPVRAILLTRHPCAVVASQLGHPSWQYVRPATSQKITQIPYADFYSDALQKIGKLDSPTKYLATIWALGFKETAMHHENNQRWMTMAYEGLLLQPDVELRRLHQRFSLPVSLQQSDLHRPSKSTPGTHPRHQTTSQRLNAWRDHLSKAQINTIFNVLDKFEIEIYSRQSEPDYDRLYSNESF